MSADAQAELTMLLSNRESAILEDWINTLGASGSLYAGRVKEAELRTQARTFLSSLRAAIASSGMDSRAGGYEAVKDLLREISRARALQGFTPSETAMFVFSLKRPVYAALSAKQGKAESTLQASWELTLLLDELGLFTTEVYQKTREEVIVRQQREIAELSTPVVKLWDGILALPLIGTLDSARTQVVMENLLQSIVDHGAQIAIIDITGVPTVDTLVAQHLLKTVAAARLMGADCIVSGIRPQIAQTMVHLGVDLDVITKSSLADAFSIALQRSGRLVTEVAEMNDVTRSTRIG